MKRGAFLKPWGRAARAGTGLVLWRAIVPSLLGRIEVNRDGDSPFWSPCSSGDPALYP